MDSVGEMSALVGRMDELTSRLSDYVALDGTKGQLYSDSLIDSYLLMVTCSKARA